MKNPAATELSEAVTSILKDYTGPINVSLITGEIKNKYPDWKLTQRRVSKFMKRYMRGDKDINGADDDSTTASMASYQSYTNERTATSSMSLSRMYRSKSKQENVLAPIIGSDRTENEPIIPEAVQEDDGDAATTEALQESIGVAAIDKAVQEDDGDAAKTEALQENVGVATIAKVVQEDVGIATANKNGISHNNTDIADNDKKDCLCSFGSCSIM